MKIAVLCIAANLKIRIKVGNVSLLKQDEKITAGRLFDELDLWMRNSDFELVPVVITCYNEIYEMAVKKHFLAFNNVFEFISEENTIRYGIASYPDADAYFVTSASEAQFFRAEIFEGICNKFKDNPDRIIISRFGQKKTILMAFAKRYSDKIRSLNEGEDTVCFDITDDIILDDRFHKVELPGGGYSDADYGEKENYAFVIPAGQVVVIRGGGRLATAVALTLHQFGYRVLITEVQNPTTLYAGMSFAQAIYTSETQIEGTSAFLVTPGKIQIQKAWNSNAIPIIIDPDCDVLQLFDQAKGKDSLLQENIYDRSSAETLKDKVKSFLDQNRLIALIDATSSIIMNPTTLNMGPVTIGLRDDQCPKVDVQYKIRTDFTSQYGKIIRKREIEIIHISQTTAAAPISKEDSDDAPNNAIITQKDKSQTNGKEKLITIYSPDSGIYTGNRNIGDEIDEYSIIGHIENIKGKMTAIFAPADGRLIAKASSETYHNKREAIAVIDTSGISKDDCFQTLPADKAIAYSILLILKNQN